MATAPPDPPSVDEAATGAVLPTTPAQALGAEFRRITHPPFETLLTVAVNAALMSSAWFFLPTSLHDQLFELHGSLAFAFVLSSWMYSDVPATNVLACDTVRTLAAIDDPRSLHRILMARRQMLWLVVAPVCLLVALVDGIGAPDRVVIVYSAIAIGVIPLGVLGVSAWIGILFPYHPIPVRYRWEHRRQWWPMLVRWGTLVLLPYGLVPLLTGVFLAPTLLIWGLTSPKGLTQKLPDNDLGLGIALACLVALGAAYFGQKASLRLVARRRDNLVAYLSDPRAADGHRGPGSVPPDRRPDRLGLVATSSIIGIGDVEHRELLATVGCGRP